MHLMAQVAVTTHIPGKLNTLYDGLSRNLTPSELGIDPHLEYKASGDSSLLAFLCLCDPDEPLVASSSHMLLLQACQQLLSTKQYSS